MAHKLRIDEVLHMTSNAIQVSQNSAPNIQYPVECRASRGRRENEWETIETNHVSRIEFAKVHLHRV